MKIKLDSIEALAKAMGGLGSHFKKMAGHHDELSKAHGEHAAFMKGKADAMTDEEMHKAAFDKIAEHHDGLSKMHKGMSEHYSSMADEHDDKAAPVVDLGKEAPATDPAAAPAAGAPPNLQTFLAGSLADAFGEVGKSADFKKMLSSWVMEEAKKALGQTVIPTTVKATGTSHDPTKDAAELLLRPGQTKPEDIVKEEMPAALAHWGANN